jgi:two-component system chemotaxis response regulator CheB
MHNRDIIVIGGSAGAAAPLKQILERLRTDLPAAIFIVLHVPAQSIGILSTVARAAGKLPVCQAEDGMAIECGRVYLAAPDHHLLLSQGRLNLGRGPRENLARPAIDPLFRSAALHYGPRVIGVILSGFLSDGADGLSAVKRCGGVALVQEPKDAIAEEMPRNALEATTVDLCVSAAELGDVLSGLVRGRADPPVQIPPDIQLEVEIAAGERIDTSHLTQIARPAALTCPSCGGVLSMVKDDHTLRFRCQVGHAFAADVLAQQQESRVDEALRVALRIIEERAELVERMAADGRRRGHKTLAKNYDSKAQEYRGYADLIRQVVLEALDKPVSEQKR